MSIQVQAAYHVNVAFCWIISWILIPVAEYKIVRSDNSTCNLIIMSNLLFNSLCWNGEIIICDRPNRYWNDYFSAFLHINTRTGVCICMKRCIIIYVMCISHGFIIIIIIIIIIYYLCAESTATRPITDTAQCRYTNNNNNTIIQ
jgi:hypothetical protein